ncbi:MAG TPA: isochorismate synthase [Gordonia sp. (in: high G+C Gram-positive bacteria)]|uniref:isochorismate synthase n=1 Tax=unclassified Gordonia (in: high G+C Gram-positive bacteria) TaxID=2657482 RepID=UPI0025C6C5FF|nr:MULTISPECIES: isochorismate synthase [unclassified Gordonia (in: high G+C Gram-positive bacteria)]HNP55595.1 isochorismate synthase [Gordonia sp. (in: high G+C Gram-positive bacteria)]HRC50496.1 isochorismate synthase [Gordonia sp. (in: high G+C Gram-positive bacteria)]
MTDPTFLLSGRPGAVRGVGATRSFTDPAAAVAALRDGAVGIVGALPFNLADPAALWEPAQLDVDTDPACFLAAQTPTPRTATVLARHPEPAEHERRVAEVVARIRDGEASKVVLARALEFGVEEPVNPLVLASAFAGGNAAHNAFAVALDAAGDRFAGQWIVGASPELLVRRRGRGVFCRPFAGTVARSSDPDTDRRRAESLRDSAKDLAEHAFVVDFLRERLAPFCSAVEAPDEPELLSTGELWHLATPVSGVLLDPTTTVLDLALALTPTPALGGTPSDAAAELIGRYEGDRGFYGGAVGWCNADGDGDWVVTIRCVGLSADGCRVRAWAGGGIVADSDPAAEVAETTAKFATALRALGADPELANR